MSSSLPETDSETQLSCSSEQDSLPLLPLGKSLRVPFKSQLGTHGTQPQGHFYKSQSTSFHKKRPLLRRKPKETQQPFLRGCPGSPNHLDAVNLQRSTSDAADIYKLQKSYDTGALPRPRFNTCNETFADELRRLNNRLDTKLHKAVAAQNVVAIADLIAAGVSTAALDHAGLTPLHLCVVKKLIRPFEVLLRHEGSANVRDAGGLSVLHVAVLHGWLPGVDAVLASGADVTAVCDASRPLLSQTRQRYQDLSYKDVCTAFTQTPIQLAAISGDITILKKMLQVAEQKQVVDCLNKRGQTSLYTAIMNGNLEAVEVLLKRGASVDKVSKRNESALHIAVRKPIILKYLLDNTNGSSTFSDYGYSPLHKAAYCNQPESVKFIVNKFNNIESKTVVTSKVNEEKSGGLTALHLAAKYFSIETAEVLLEMGANANAVDDLGNTPLHLAAKTMNKGISALLLRYGAVLSAKDDEGNSALQIIASKFHDALSFFEMVFDEFVCTKGLYPMGTTVVCVNYEVLSRNNDIRQIKAIEEFVSCGLRKVLLHPFIESLLYLKWKQLLPVFYVIITVYAIFLISFNIFIVNVFYCKDNHGNTTQENCTTNNTLNCTKHIKKSGELPWFDMFDKWYYLLLALIYTTLLLLLMQESFYIYLRRLRYFVCLESWVKLIGIALAGSVPLIVHHVEMIAWQRHLACASLLLVWLQAMLLLSRFPGWGYYVLMFGKVAINMFKVFITSTCLVVAFAFCFMIQFQSEPPFDGPTSAIVKTLIMMSSEFDYEDLFSKENHKHLKHSRTIVRLLFVVFVIFVAIVLVNFMIAVAVSDTKNLNIAGNISRLEKQVDLLSSLDVLVNSGPLMRLFKKKYGGKSYHKKMYNSIKANRTWFVECASTIEMYPQILPSALYKAILDIARKKDERAKEADAKKKSINKIDTLYDAIIGKPTGSDHDQENVYWLQETILKQNEKINQLSCDIASMKEMLLEISKTLEDRTSL